MTIGGAMWLTVSLESSLCWTGWDIVILPARLFIRQL